MKKEYRVKKGKEIEMIVKRRQSVGNKNFVLYKKENHENKHFRFAVSVSKKFGNAVKRNKIKRQVREVVSKHDNELFLKADNNYFIIGETVNLYHNDSYEMQRALPAGQVKIIKAYQNQAVAYPVTLRGDQIREGDWVEVGHLTIPNKPASYFTARNQCAAVSIANL